MLDNPKTCHLIQYWEQCVEQANRFKKIPFLIFTKNYKPWYSLLDVTLLGDPIMDTESLSIPSPYLAIIIKMTSKKNYTLTIFKLDDFIKANIQSNPIKKLREKYKTLMEKG